jgi:hypothetical protein
LNILLEFLEFRAEQNHRHRSHWTTWCTVT